MTCDVNSATLWSVCRLCLGSDDDVAKSMAWTAASICSWESRTEVLCIEPEAIDKIHANYDLYDQAQSWSGHSPSDVFHDEWP